MSDEQFGQNLSTWLDEDAAHRVPSHVNELLVLSAATRQRPWWSSLERWLPMSTTTMGGRLAAPRPMLLFALLAALLAAIVGATLLAAAVRQPRPLFGLAANGRILISDGGSLKSFAADGTNPATVAAIPGGVGSLSLSPDATRVALAPGAWTDPLRILTISDGSTVQIAMPEGALVAGKTVGWSPDGRFVTYAGVDAGIEHVFVAATDGSAAAAALPDAALGPDHGIWAPSYSPDGTWIAFTEAPGGSTGGDNGLLYLVHPDGTNLHSVTSGVSFGDAGFPAWAPDPAVERILYVTLDGTRLSLMVRDMQSNAVDWVGAGFWPSWSPDGAKIAYWGGGVSVVATSDVLAGYPLPIHVFADYGGSETVKMKA